LQLEAYADGNIGASTKPLRRRRRKRGPQQLLR
jgi:hypothetical protein